jgi:16S rRNA (cytosine1407-C5)-methyltransferase
VNPVSEKILTYLNSLYGEKGKNSFVDFVNSEPSLFIRINSLKTNKESIKKILLNYGLAVRDLPLSNALKIESDKEILSKTIEHVIGLFYIQSLSSMLPSLILAPSGKDKVLDLCAAPGSKTTMLAETMNNKGTLIANEIQLSRLKALVYNIDRMNILNAGILHYKGELLSKIYNNYFDKILVDAPCSGLGIIQKKDEVSSWWSEEKIASLSELQLKLLVAAIKMAKPGGEIVYSTCTLTVEENEFVIDKVLNKYPVELADANLPVKAHEGFTEYPNKTGKKFNNSISKAKRILPWEVNSEGFFITKLIKTGKTEPNESLSLKEKLVRFLNHNQKELKEGLKNLALYFGIDNEIFADYKFILKGNDIFFTNEEWEDEKPGIFERIGTKFGSVDKRGEIILHTQAAQILQKQISKNIFEINDKEDLKKYIEGGIIKKHFGEGAQCLVKYNDFILGSAVNTTAGIKSRFPRAKRTQEINVDF